jgi:hypothetical protein
MKRLALIVAGIGNASNDGLSSEAGSLDELNGRLAANSFALATPGVEGVEAFAAPGRAFEIRALSSRQVARDLCRCVVARCGDDDETAEVRRIAFSSSQINAFSRFGLMKTARSRNCAAAWGPGTPVSRSCRLSRVSRAL